MLDFKGLFSKIIKSKDTEKTNNESVNNENNVTSSDKNIFIDNINKFSAMLESIIFKEPLVHSLSYENNIAYKLDEKILITRDGNICAGLKLEGISYAGATQDNELELAQTRMRFFNRLDSSIELNIVCKKELIDLNLEERKTNNHVANQIISKWENATKAYKINYYLIFSTKTKRVTGFFESKKRALTEERAENENKENRYKDKVAKMNEILGLAKKDLAELKVKELTSNDLLNLYATYSNMSETKLRYSYDLITDCYMTSDVEFKKDYMIFYTNRNETIYARFISVKAYESEAINKAKRTRTFAVDIVKNELDLLVQELQSDRENIIKVSLSIMIISKDSLADLNEQTESIRALLESQSLSVAKETLNQKPLFFSFYPSRGNLNARQRHQTSAVLSTLCTFENDILGNKSNRWGKQPITIFKHLSGSPYFFNFHDSDSNSSVGHTLVIGGTGYGKTTIMQFLMLNLFKYDINIFAMDKMRGMHNFTHFVEGEYHDLENSSFKFNPFSLENTEANNTFLKTWLCQMGQIDDTNHDFKDIVTTALTSIRNVEGHREHHINSFKDFYDSLTLPNDPNANLKQQFAEFKDSLFNSQECALNFNKQLSILNMDSILTNPQITALSAMYMFHKIKTISQAQNKGFFIWIDELRDYLADENMKDRIIEAIVEIRKINGVITMGIQNLDFLDRVSNSNTFIDNMSNYIVFPTSDSKNLDRLKVDLSLSDTEINFLKTAGKESRQILFKQKEVGSCILEVDLSRLGDYLRVFSSSSDDVALLKHLKENYPANWRDMYLKNIRK
ncbi:AAA family ATPase [Helicobacter bilis]|uniref:AAA family ATPase n=2 Tax=Helicobacter bilis TaxID=37372 RepID=A0A6D2C515_9HELI|nr:FtsK/SpoIIIE domain-containing protein [Helicobacter bilis]EMZ37217.1 VirB4 family type IV secretion/conjugal transfer ATPase [Helicobacter bilis WiWa]TLE03991.1 AAA family ATPase [Helicobacter bilis]TLE04716.1 AAA family ATPase [Helicobacter bilis]